MIADIILLIWLVMAAILGSKRKALLEFNSLIILLISYALARIIAMNLAAPLAPSMTFGKTTLGPVGTEMVVSFVLFLVLYIALGFVWKKVRPAEDQAGIRIELDAQGEPVVSGNALKVMGGVLFGVLRGGLMYLAVLLWLTLLVPIMSYKDGQGLTVIHPNAYSIKAIRKVDPIMQRIEWTARGLRSLQYVKRNRAARRKAKRNPAIKTLLKSKELRNIRKKSGLLKRANSKKQGRRDSTLLLWMQSFQQAVATTKASDALKQLAQAIPAPFDGGKALKSKKKRKRRRRK